MVIVDNNSGNQKTQGLNPDNLSKLTDIQAPNYVCADLRLGLLGKPDLIIEWLKPGRPLNVGA